MKKLLRKSIPLLIIMTLVLCGNKSFAQIQFSTADSVIEYLEGKWRWYITCGGFVPTCFYPDSAKNTDLVFTKVNGSSDSIQYSSFLNDSLTNTGYYKIVYKSTIFGDKWTVENDVLSAITTDTMWLSDNSPDSYSSSYVKINLILSNPEMQINEWLVFPNPTRGRVSVRSNRKIDYVQVWDMTGRLVHSSSKKEIDLSGNRSGIYLVRVTSEGRSVIKKVYLN